MSDSFTVCHGAFICLTYFFAMRFSQFRNSPLISFCSMVVIEGSNTTMKVSALVLLALGLGSVACHAQSNQPAEKQYSRAQLNLQVKTAHNTREYQDLAAYFRQQQKALQAKADEEKALWAARSQTAILYNKYPKPADSAHNLYDYYTFNADSKGKLADHYQQLAISEPATTTTASNR